MRVGIPTETKNNEFRVAITPAGVAELTRRGHEVLIQAGAGEGSAITDADFKAAGAQLVGTADQVWADADLLLKVKEPIAAEYGRLRHGQILFTFLHLAASRACTDALLDSGTTSIAYETVQTADGALPLLAPMSEVAGRLAAQVGAYHLMRTQGGRGVLMGGVPGVEPADVVVIGAGTAGYNAARIANGMGATVTVLDINIDKLRQLDAEFCGRIHTRYSSAYELEGAVKPPPSAVCSTDSAQRCSQPRPGVRMPSDTCVCSASRLTSVNRGLPLTRPVPLRGATGRLPRTNRDPKCSRTNATSPS